MSINIIDNFNVYTNKPIDSRTTVADTTERDNLNTNYRYEGMMVFVTGSNDWYQLRDGTTNSDWTLLQLDGSGSFSGSFQGDGSGLTQILTSSITNFDTEVSRSVAEAGFGSGGGGGESNTASNIGTGFGLFAQKSGVDLEFKSVTGSHNILITTSSNLAEFKVQFDNYTSGLPVGSDGDLARSGSNLFVFV